MALAPATVVVDWTDQRKYARLLAGPAAAIVVVDDDLILAGGRRPEQSKAPSRPPPCRSSVKGRKEKEQREGGSGGGCPAATFADTHTRRELGRFCLSPPPRTVGRAGRLFRSALHAQIRLHRWIDAWMDGYLWPLGSGCRGRCSFFCNLLLYYRCITIRYQHPSRWYSYHCHGCFACFGRVSFDLPKGRTGPTPERFCTSDGLTSILLH